MCLKELKKLKKSSMTITEINMKNKDELLKELQALEAAEPISIIKHPGDLNVILLKYAYKPVEYFLCVTLNGMYEIINIHKISKGLANRTLVHPREVFIPAIKDHAIAVILAHNHPSGNPDPSKEDREITERLKQAGEIIGINVLDHIIISKRDTYSFSEHDEL